MSYFPGFFITQFHKNRAGYFINHDLLIQSMYIYPNIASPDIRKKLIFYFIA